MLPLRCGATPHALTAHAAPPRAGSFGKQSLPAWTVTPAASAPAIREPTLCPEASSCHLRVALRTG